MWGLAIAFFGVIIGVNVWLAVVSAISWTGMVVTDPYVAGQQFETNRIAHEAQQAAGWTPTFTYEAGVARLVIVDGQNRPVELGTVTLLVNRPVGGHDDKKVTLERADNGDYTANVDVPAGYWEALVTAPDTAKGPFTTIARFRVAEASP
jgi:nitrogen fixation protein FixH